uniref:UNC93-like protein MFSD11 n=1 Tax=Heterorhabditis bacteriophora TaxID=37862 RepID=A0A1I7WG83_HETBA
MSNKDRKLHLESFYLKLELVEEDGLEDHLISAEEEVETVGMATSASVEFKRTFSLLMTKEMIALSIPFMYSGIETTFYTGVYSACLSAFSALNKESEVVIAYAIFSLGIGQTIGGFSFGVCASFNKLSRSHVIVFGTVLHLAAFFLCFLNIPMEAPLHKTSTVAYIEPSMLIALVTALLLGLADSCWNTQIYTLIGILYKNEASSAFALFKFFQTSVKMLIGILSNSHVLQFI